MGYGLINIGLKIRLSLNCKRVMLKKAIKVVLRSLKQLLIY